MVKVLSAVGTHTIDTTALFYDAICGMGDRVDSDQGLIMFERFDAHIYRFMYVPFRDFQTADCDFHHRQQGSTFFFFFARSIRRSLSVFWCLVSFISPAKKFEHPIPHTTQGLTGHSPAHTEHQFVASQLDVLLFAFASHDEADADGDGARSESEEGLSKGVLLLIFHRRAVLHS